MPVTAVRTAVSPGHARPSRPKVCAQSGHWYAFLRTVPHPPAPPRPHQRSARGTQEPAVLAVSVRGVLRAMPGCKFGTGEVTQTLQALEAGAGRGLRATAASGVGGVRARA